MAALASVLLLAAAPTAPAGAAPRRPLVTAAVQVTDNPSPVRAHSSPQIAVNPKNGELVIVESDVRGTRRCNVHISVDDGRSWFRGGDPMREPNTDCSFYAEYGPYASMAFARDGTLYIAFIASERLNRARDDTPRHVLLARSTDGGRTFTTTVVFRAPDGNRDRGLNKGPMLAVDPSDPKRVYVGWRQGVFREATEKLKSNVAASGDGGRTFSPPVDVTDERGGDYPAMAVDGEGVVHAVYWTRTFPPIPFDEPNPVRPIQYVRSTDHGRTWTRKVIDAGNQRATRPPLIAADPRSRSVYVTWYGNAEPDNQRPGFAGDMEVFLVASSDGGRTWGKRRVLNDDQPRAPGMKANQFDPGISIGPNGRVDVAWYDGRLSPLPPAGGTGEDERGFQDVFFTSSTDGGRTFSPNHRISDRSIDRSVGVWSNNIDSKHNVGVASTEDAVYVAWQDSRNGTAETGAEDVYSAVLRLGGRRGEATASGLPPWAPLAAGVSLGMGVAAVAVATRGRRPPRPTR